MACTSGCATQDHGSYSECLRSKTVRVAYANSAGGWDLTKQKTLDSDLAAYRDARSQGIQPSGTSREAVDRAVRLSDAAGVAWDAGAGA
jgi:hypothetical protein